MMATLVVGPFYLSGALALSAAEVGLAMSCGPAVAALAGVPSGRLVDRFGPYGTTIAGLAAMALGASLLPYAAARWSVPGYVAPLAVITAGYALFQAANNTSVMADLAAEQRGVVSGLLNLSRNLGLVTGASVMGAVFSVGAHAVNVASADPQAVANGMRMTFTVAAALVFAALAIAATARIWGKSRQQGKREERQRAR
jgi:MFS family permease